MIHCRALLLLVLATVLGAAAAHRASADVDVEVPLGFVAKGTLLPAGEIETYRFRAAGRWLLTFQAKSAKGAHLRFDMHLFDSLGAEVPIPAKARKRTPGTLTIRQLRIPSTDSYRLEVSAKGTGDYTLTLGGKFPPNVKVTQEVPQGVNVPFNFTAPAKSRVALTARAAPGSPAKPRLVRLVGEGLDLDLTGLGTTTANSHTVVIPSVGGKGDLAVEVVNPDGATGDVVVTATVTAPAVTIVRLDNRGGKRGHADGGETVVARSIGTAGGTVEITDATSELLGAKVTIPPAAVAANTTITMASAPPVTPPDAGDQAAGPALFLGPSGLTFAAAVEVVLPYDPAQIPVGQTPQDLRVLVVEANGSSSILVPTSVDELGRAITVEANGFSTIVPIAVRGQQPLGVRPGGDAFWSLSVEAELEPDVSKDSRKRWFVVEMGEASFQSGGVFQLATERRRIDFDNPTAVGGGSLAGSVAVSSASENATSTWTYGTDGQSVVVATDDGPQSVTTSRDGNFLVGRGNDPAESSAEIVLLVRKNTTPLTKASLAGRYHLMIFGLQADPGGGKVGVRWRSMRAVGTVTLSASGRYTSTYSQRSSTLSAAGAETTRFQSATDAGTFSVEAAGTVIATTPPSEPGDSAPVLRFRPGPGGAVMIGTVRDAPVDEELQVYVLIRHGSGLGNGTLQGAYRGAEFDTETEPYTVPRTGTPNLFHIEDFEIVDQELAVTFSGTGSLTLDASKHSAQRDASSTGGVLVENVAEPQSDLPYKVDRTGKFTIPGAATADLPVGAVTRDGMFGSAVKNVASPQGGNLLLFFVKLPPAK